MNNTRRKRSVYWGIADLVNILQPIDRFVPGTCLNFQITKQMLFIYQCSTENPQETIISICH